MSNENRITQLSDLVPGQLYVCGWTHHYITVDPLPETEYGSLVWYSADGLFYNADSDDYEEDINAQRADFWVAQVGAFNEEYAAA